MRKALLALTLLLALAALVPNTFAAEAPAAGPALAASHTAPNLASPAVSPSQPDADFTLWLTAQPGQGTQNPLILCNQCVCSSRICCDKGDGIHCYCGSIKFGC